MRRHINICGRWDLQESDANTYPDQLLGGMPQRVAIAQAFSGARPGHARRHAETGAHAVGGDGYNHSFRDAQYCRGALSGDARGAEDAAMGGRLEAEMAEFAG